MMRSGKTRPGRGCHGGLIPVILLLLSGGLSQAALEPQLCQRGEVLLADDFEDFGTVPGRWFFREQWTVAKGTMIRTAVPGENQRVFVKKPRYGNCIIELKVAFQGAGEIRVMTGTPGKYVPIRETVRGFQEILSGQHDELPEQAFYMVGTIDEAVEKATELAEA